MSTCTTKLWLCLSHTRFGTLQNDPPVHRQGALPRTSVNATWHTAGRRLPETWDSLSSWFLGIERLKSQRNCGSLPMKGPWEGHLSEKDH